MAYQGAGGGASVNCVQNAGRTEGVAAGGLTERGDKGREEEKRYSDSERVRYGARQVCMPACRLCCRALAAGSLGQRKAGVPRNST